MTTNRRTFLASLLALLPVVVLARVARPERKPTAQGVTVKRWIVIMSPSAGRNGWRIQWHCYDVPATLAMAS